MAAEPALLDNEMIEQLRTALTPEMNAELLDSFRAQVHTCLEELTEAIRRGDHSERQRIAHGLKGSSATMGANRMSLFCQRLQAAGAEPGEQQIEQLRRLADESLQALAEALA
jgi:HPt (histidine-containing phosphotransfer) domain-containing protein